MEYLHLNIVASCVEDLKLADWMDYGPKVSLSGGGREAADGKCSSPFDNQSGRNLTQQSSSE